jgi:hypothetical protein
MVDHKGLIGITAIPVNWSFRHCTENFIELLAPKRGCSANNTLSKGLLALVPSHFFACSFNMRLDSPPPATFPWEAPEGRLKEKGGGRSALPKEGGRGGRGSFVPRNKDR